MTECEFCHKDVEKGFHDPACPLSASPLDGNSILRLMYNVGWECPRCARIYGPTVTDCSPCNKKIKED